MLAENRSIKPARTRSLL